MTRRSCRVMGRLTLPLMLGGAALSLAVPSGPWQPDGPQLCRHRPCVSQNPGLCAPPAARQSDEADAAVSGLVLLAMLSSGKVSPDDQHLQKGLAALEELITAELADADTARSRAVALALLVFQRAGGSRRYQALIRHLVHWLRAVQCHELQGYRAEDAFYGGTGLTRLAPPDLLSTAMALEGLREAGLSPQDPYVHRALTFVSRCQYLTPDCTELVSACHAHTGGFRCLVTCPGPAGGHLPLARPDGAMTCTGLKCLLDAGLSAQDARVRAATAWLRRNYTLTVNPGAAEPRRGLYYYYWALAKALSSLGQNRFVDASGVSHNWRDELGRVLLAEQLPDGSWSNRRRSDGHAGSQVIPASYALLALSYVRHSPSSESRKRSKPR